MKMRLNTTTKICAYVTANNVRHGGEKGRSIALGKKKAEQTAYRDLGKIVLS